jgi:nucleotide-binding universal stress UspA family protein
METTNLQGPAGQETEYGLKRIVVAYDASPSAQRALDDAITIGKRFKAEILLAQANAPDDEPGNSCSVLRTERMLESSDLEAIRSRLASAGLSSRGIVRGGIVGDTLFNICCEENADLLLLGAYGYGLKDRQTLGSTAEYLLRAVPCLTLTYGPNVTSTFDLIVHKGPVLVPVSLPCPLSQLQRAMEVARLFGVKLEILHVADHVKPAVIHDLEYQCEQLTEHLRRGGIRAQWSLYCGMPDTVIRSRGVEIDSPFILMPLKWGHSLSSITSDNVAARVIRCSKIPVMTYKVD